MFVYILYINVYYTIIHIYTEAQVGEIFARHAIPFTIPIKKPKTIDRLTKR